MKWYLQASNITSEGDRDYAKVYSENRKSHFKGKKEK